MSAIIALYPLLLAIGIDLLLGEPPNRWHPVVWMGRLIAALQRRAPRRGRMLAFLYGGAHLPGRWRGQSSGISNIACFWTATRLLSSNNASVVTAGVVG